MIAAPDKAKKVAQRWPLLARVGTAADAIDMGQGTFSLLWPVLAAHYGLKVHRAGGTKIDLDSLMEVLGELRQQGKPIVIHKRTRTVHVGEARYERIKAATR